MANYLRQSSLYTVRLGSFISLLDGITPIASASSVVLANCEEAEILKGDLAPVTVSMGGALSVITGVDGWYDYVLTAGETDTVGPLTIVVQSVATCLPYHKDFQVVSQSIYDARYASGAVSAVTLHAGVHSGATIECTPACSVTAETAPEA